VISFGVVSGLLDVGYEGARSIIGPFLGDLGASAALIGLITGAGEAAALVFRLVTGWLADRTAIGSYVLATQTLALVLLIPLLATRTKLTWPRSWSRAG
jgi:nitrate/nitrite transporter NarK